MIIYSYACDACKIEYSVNQQINDEHVFDCPKCKQRCRRLFTKHFIIHGWSAANELKEAEYEKKMWNAFTDESEVTQTMVDTAKEQLTRRAERRGENPAEVVSEVFGGSAKQPRSKADLAVKAKKQREMIDRKETL
jgi:putative FmdB family regulatory protein